ncbi:MAG TPA: response regulator [Thermoanaerobaculia bacterium]|nr:response regulator [Thermoanaerobaculia bacterium]
MPKKILLADDSITIQKVVELTFSDGDYEVTAVNNGAKAVQKLAEMRPDIILSDIIMPEKNGYEVCEYVKSHPDFRNIPVVLLTGTFEPFDPDRAEKAGCDAVVTKPFESQSLIHKVEELIAAAQSAAAAPAAEAAQEPATASPWMEEAPEETPEPPASSFSTASGDAFAHEPDIFGAAPTPEATTEMPFELPPSGEFSGETRAFPRMSFDDLAGAAPAAEPPPPPPAPEPSPWDEPAEQKSTFGEFAAPAPEAESPFGAPPPAEEFSGETRAFPRMSFDEPANAAPAQEAAPEPEPNPWNEPAAPAPFGEEPEAPAFSGETRAFPKMSFDDLQQMAASTPPPAAEQEPSPWGEPSPAAPAFEDDTPAFTDDVPAFSTEAPAFGEDAPAFAEDAPAFGGETRAFPKLNFDDFQSPAAEPEAAAPPPSVVPDFSAPEPEAAPWDAPSEAASPFSEPADDEPRPVEPVESLWSPTADTSSIDSLSTESFSTAGAAPFADTSSPFAEETASEPLPEDLPFASETTSEPEPPTAAEPAWSLDAAAEATAAVEAEEPPAPPAALTPDAPPMSIARGGELSDEQVDRIARRVVELMSDQVVRNIAWEVIPDLAEMVVKERIRQLEAEA